MRRPALLLFQLSKWIPKGKRTSEIQTEMVGYLKNWNAHFYYVLPLFSLCLVQCLTFCQVRRCADQVFLQRNWTKDETVLPRASVRAHTFLALSYNSTSELLRRMLVLKVCQSKDLFFPFTPLLFSWDMAHCQANVSLLLERDILRCFT